MEVQEKKQESSEDHSAYCYHNTFWEASKTRTSERREWYRATGEENKQNLNHKMKGKTIATKHCGRKADQLDSHKTNDKHKQAKGIR
eukprot:12092063-Heterocapsa_arctica.AAC.1